MPVTREKWSDLDFETKFLLIVSAFLVFDLTALIISAIAFCLGLVQ